METGGGSRAAKKRRRKKQKQEHNAVQAQDPQARLSKKLKASSVEEQETMKQTSTKKDREAEDNLAPFLVKAPEEDKKMDEEARDEALGLLGLHAHEIVGDPDMDSREKASHLLQWILAPLPLDTFYESYWEKQAVLVRRGGRKAYYHGWLSSKDIHSFTEAQSLQYGVDLDVTNYVDGKRMTLNPAPNTEGGAAYVSADYVWKKFKEGCSLRMPCPQKFSDTVHSLLSALEEEWGCMVGSNAYLTPAGHQGFAPHWDDVEAFILQVEGKKHWKVYAPRDEREALPRQSSPNLSQNDVGEPLIEATLEPGDMLYLPRGWIHQAEAVGKKASLHVTVSSMQGNAYVDFLETLLPAAINIAAAKHVDLRRGLPGGYLEYMGISHSESGEELQRRSFTEKLKSHMQLVMHEALQVMDDTADQMGIRYISDRLPPVFAPEEENQMVGEAPPNITAATIMRVVRRGIARLVVEDDKAVVYHVMDNARVHHEAPLRPVEFELDDAPAIELLLASYPAGVEVGRLPHPPAEDLDDKVGVALALFNEGILMIMPEVEEE
ncbi:unnamed protein product [Chrysoparadoxa australica]